MSSTSPVSMPSTDEESPKDEIIARIEDTSGLSRSYATYCLEIIETVVDKAIESGDRTSVTIPGRSAPIRARKIQDYSGGSTSCPVTAHEFGIFRSL